MRIAIHPPARDSGLKKVKKFGALITQPNGVPEPNGQQISEWSKPSWSAGAKSKTRG
jgi:hypothetical protein